jgi:hypothetical protein
MDCGTRPEPDTLDRHAMNTPPVPPAAVTHPVDDAINRTFVERFMRATVIVGITASCLYCLAIFLFVPEQTSRYGGPVIAGLVMVGVHFLLRAGRTRQAVLLLSGGIWLVATLFGFVIGGPNTPILAIYPVLMVFVGWAYSQRAAIVLAVSSIIVLVSIAFAQHAGMLGSFPPTPPAMYVVAQSLVIVLATLLVAFLVRANREQVARQRRLGEAIAGAQPTSSERARPSSTAPSRWARSAAGCSTSPATGSACRPRPAGYLACRLGATGSIGAYLAKYTPRPIGPWLSRPGARRSRAAGSIMNIASASAATYAGSGRTPSSNSMPKAGSCGPWG